MELAIESIMAGQYRSPTLDEQLLFHKQLEAAAHGPILVDIAEVEASRGVPWEPKSRFIDVTLKVRDRAIIPGLEEMPSSHAKTGSSGTHAELVPGVCHAASEALERFLIAAGGDSSLRPTKHSVFSVFKKQWKHLPYHPLFPRTQATRNPHFSRSGEAFNIHAGEAFRAAYCEVLEREALCQFVAGGADPLDVTEFAADLVPEARAAAEYWRSANYDLRFAMIPSRWGVCVILAVCRTTDGSFPAVFKGSGADFRLPHAVRQAISELGRNAFFGPAARLKTRKEVEQFVTDKNTHWSEADNMKLTLPENSWIVSPVFQAPRGDESQLRSLEGACSPQHSLERLKEAGHELWVMPVARDFLGISGAAFKVIVPGFPQVHRFVKEGA